MLLFCNFADLFFLVVHTKQHAKRSAVYCTFFLMEMFFMAPDFHFCWKMEGYVARILSILLTANTRNRCDDAGKPSPFPVCCCSQSPLGVQLYFDQKWKRPLTQTKNKSTFIHLFHTQSFVRYTAAWSSTIVFILYRRSMILLPYVFFARHVYCQSDRYTQKVPHLNC